MKERPILFKGPMVRALLDGTKTQTRRVVKMKRHQQIEEREDGTPWPWMYDGDRDADSWMACPYGQPGDRLWVRETFAEGIHQLADVNHWAYAADPFGNQQRLGDRWKPSIHMPRWASRITLEITGVRVERLQDISEADAIAEGIERQDDGIGWRRGPITADVPNTATRTAFPKLAYQSLWESINGPGSWAANPWGWVIEFRRGEV